MGRRPADRPTSIVEIAAAQAIPPRFLELILNDLRQGKLVNSQRGEQGGYTLAREPSEITVGDVVRLMEGPIEVVKCISGGDDCPFRNKCAFLETWTQAGQAMQNVFDSTTLQDLLDRQPHVSVELPSYCI
ncbi:MAG: Rrf2 family transcriptional regulator [Planctomycetota bacterium]|nr:Rrf2 family transcriptional regulator [Planctomycetota bacterium]